MVSQLIALALLTFGQSESTVVNDATTLSHKRAQFGERREAGKEWLYWTTGEVMPTIMLFPEGRANVRYFFSELPTTDYSKKRWVVNCQTRDAQGIHLKWCIDLVKLKTKKQGVGIGTLAAFLRSQGFKPPRTRGAIKVALSSKTPLAAYQFLVPAAGLSCWYVRANGQEVDPKVVPLPNTFRVPDFDAPYLISKSEQKGLRIRRVN